MALFEGDDWRRDYEGRPPLRPHVCVGYIVRHQSLPDGRYNLMLQGVCRARIIEELDTGTPYRQAVLRPTETKGPMEIDLDETRRRIESLMRDPHLQQLASISAIRNHLSDEVSTAALLDLVIATTCDNVEQRYAMLAESRVQDRANWVERLLKQTRRTLATAARFQPQECEDGVSLN